MSNVRSRGVVNDGRVVGSTFSASVPRLSSSRLSSLHSASWLIKDDGVSMSVSRNVCHRGAVLRISSGIR
ncbi:hypothetical protein B0H12DRAFT_1097170 [Mycena haematopus]|nr:hypothetical protein B0H12DRAFT_1097170 [Mycena haematopus]